MAKVSIEIESLVEALEGSGEGVRYFLDLQTGETVVTDYGGYIELDEETAEAMEEEPERFRAIERVPSRQAFGIMESFVESRVVPPARDALRHALEGRHPFRAFRDVLAAFPEVRDDWFTYHDDAYRQLAVEWLRDEGIKDVELRSVRDRGQTHEQP